MKPKNIGPIDWRCYWGGQVIIEASFSLDGVHYFIKEYMPCHIGVEEPLMSEVLFSSIRKMIDALGREVLSLTGLSSPQ